MYKDKEDQENSKKKRSKIKKYKTTIESHEARDLSFSIQDRQKKALQTFKSSLISLTNNQHNEHCTLNQFTTKVPVWHLVEIDEIYKTMELS